MPQEAPSQWWDQSPQLQDQSLPTSSVSELDTELPSSVFSRASATGLPLLPTRCPCVCLSLS